MLSWPAMLAVMLLKVKLSGILDPTNQCGSSEQHDHMKWCHVRTPTPGPGLALTLCHLVLCGTVYVPQVPGDRQAAMACVPDCHVGTLPQALFGVHKQLSEATLSWLQHSGLLSDRRHCTAFSIRCSPQSDVAAGVECYTRLIR